MAPVERGEPVERGRPVERGESTGRGEPAGLAEPVAPEASSAPVAPADSRVPAPPDAAAGAPVYVLITQCLQNDFFLNQDCHLSLPDGAVAKFLADPEGADGSDGFATDGHRRTLSAAALARSPLARFLEATVGARLRGHGEGVLHLVNIRDWHVQGESYELERGQYGAHCEAGSWGAGYIAGLEPLLEPTLPAPPDAPPGADAAESDVPPGASGGVRLRVHHVRSASLFDFQRHEAGRPVPRRSVALGALLDDLLGAGRHESAHVAVVGVLTDIKVQLLLTELRSRYNVRRLVVSDALTASRTLERHLSALDFCARVLRAEVMPGLDELVRFLGSRPEDDRTPVRGGETEFAAHTTWFQDRQGILSYEDARLREYRLQTAQRLRQAQHSARFAGRFLLGLGAALLTTALVLSLLGQVLPGRTAWQVPAVFGTLGAGQIVTVFFTRPVRSLRDALAEETIYRMILESRSLKVALARFHVTAAGALRRHGDADAQLDALERQLTLLERIDAADFEHLKTLGAPPAGTPGRGRRGPRGGGAPNGANGARMPDA